MDDSNLKFGQWLRAPSVDRFKGRGSRTFNSNSVPENSNDTNLKEAVADQAEKKRQDDVSVGTNSDVQTKKTVEDIQPMVDSGLLVDCLVQQDPGSVIVSFQEKEPVSDIPSEDTDEAQSDFQSSKSSLCGGGGDSRGKEGWSNEDSVPNLSAVAGSQHRRQP
ncbi:hypothetical protein ACOSQ3_012048 [Xanthoceras sorbifolium]